MHPAEPAQLGEDAKRSSQTSSALPSQQQHDVVNLIDLSDPADEPTPQGSASKDANMNNSSNNPAPSQAMPPPENVSSEMKDKIAEELPPSKLLHSNSKVDAPSRDSLTRQDSRTLETDEFHDAQS